jgi:hypothetical protein
MSARNTPISRLAPSGKSKMRCQPIRIVVTTPRMSAAPFSDRSGRNTPNRPPVIAAPIATAPTIRKSTSAIVHNSQPLRLTPSTLAHGRNRDVINSTPPAPAISRRKLDSPICIGRDAS